MVTPVLTAPEVGVASKWIDSVWTRTPGTSVRELRGPGGKRPSSLWMAGWRSRIRRRGGIGWDGIGVVGEVDILSWGVGGGGVWRVDGRGWRKGG